MARVDELARVENGKSCKDLRKQRTKVNHPVGFRMDQHDGKRPIPNVLLMFNVPVHGKKGIESALSPGE